MNLEETIQEFNSIYSKNRMSGDTKHNFYCGITNDIERRAGEHNTSFLYYVISNDADSAKELEAALHDEGYDTGDKVGNGTDESIYVYIYRKIQTTIE